MKLEEYEHEGRKWYKLGYIGIRVDRAKNVSGKFVGFYGPPESGWYKLKVEGVDVPVVVSEAWVRDEPPLSEGETLDILLDTRDGTAWRIERISGESEVTVTLENANKMPAKDKEIPSKPTETTTKWQLSEGGQ